VQRLQTRAAATAAGAHGGLPGLRAQLTQPAAASASAVRFRPCIDIHQGKVKQIVGSTLKDDASGDRCDSRRHRPGCRGCHAHRCARLCRGCAALGAARRLAYLCKLCGR